MHALLTIWTSTGQKSRRWSLAPSPADRVSTSNSLATDCIHGEPQGQPILTRSSRECSDRFGGLPASRQVGALSGSAPVSQLPSVPETFRSRSRLCPIKIHQDWVSHNVHHTVISPHQHPLLFMIPKRLHIGSTFLAQQLSLADPLFPSLAVGPGRSAPRLKPPRSGNFLCAARIHRETNFLPQAVLHFVAPLRVQARR